MAGEILSGGFCGFCSTMLRDPPCGTRYPCPANAPRRKRRKVIKMLNAHDQIVMPGETGLWCWNAMQAAVVSCSVKAAAGSGLLRFAVAAWQMLLREIQAICLLMGTSESVLSTVSAASSLLHIPTHAAAWPLRARQQTQVRREKRLSNEPRSVHISLDPALNPHYQTIALVGRYIARPRSYKSEAMERLAARACPHCL